MKISVIIPVYNVASYLSQCLESVINQTYTDLQIIVVDDGSSDGSEKICDEYAAKDNRLSVYHRKNSGVSASLNYGLSVASGDYIAMVDSDDFIHPKMLEILYDSLTQNDAGLAACKWTCGEKRISELNISNAETVQINPVKEFEKFYSEVNVYRWNKLYKKELFNGFTYPEGHVYEDEFIHRIVYNCPCAIIVDLPLYFYRQREGSIMHSFPESRVYDSFLGVDDRIAFMHEHNWTEGLAFTYFKYCDRAKWVWNCIKDSSIKNRKLCNFCRQKVKSMLEENTDASVPIRFRLWSKNIFLYYMFTLAMFILCWEKSNQKCLRPFVDFLIKIRVVPKIKNKNNKVITVVATDTFGYKEVHYVLYSLFRQSHKPDNIMLWLPEDDFAIEEVQNDKILSRFIRNGLSVMFYKYSDWGVDQQFTLANKMFPDSNVIVCNEKWFYPKKWLQRKLESQ